MVSIRPAAAREAILAQDRLGISSPGQVALRGLAVRLAALAGMVLIRQRTAGITVAGPVAGLVI
jgi:hypothetical protein